jgi:hypothetical protein
MEGTIIIWDIATGLPDQTIYEYGTYPYNLSHLMAVSLRSQGRKGWRAHPDSPPDPLDPFSTGQEVIKSDDPTVVAWSLMASWFRVTITVVLSSGIHKGELFKRKNVDSVTSLHGPRSAALRHLVWHDHRWDLTTLQLLKY